MIYHYTSGTSLIGVLGNSEFWATDINFLNDHKEHILGYEASIDFIKKAMTEEFREPFQSWFDLFYSQILSLTEVNIIDRAAYVVSFSKKPDSIAHWFSYCEKNQGYCIGFEEDDFLYKDEANLPDHAYRFEDVVYGDVESMGARLNGLISKDAIVRRMENSLRAAKLLGIDTTSGSPFSERYKESTGMDILAEIFSELIFSSCAYKEAGFIHEDERRLVISLREISGESGGLSSSTKFRERNGVIYPYVPIKFDPLSIREIVIGPCSDYSLKEAGLSKLLKSKGIECKITRSASSLRFT